MVGGGCKKKRRKNKSRKFCKVWGRKWGGEVKRGRRVRGSSVPVARSWGRVLENVCKPGKRTQKRSKTNKLRRRKNIKRGQEGKSRGTRSKGMYKKSREKRSHSHGGGGARGGESNWG